MTPSTHMKLNHVENLGYKTDLMLLSWDAVLTEHPDHITALTPTNPSYHWGNFILFDEPPRPETSARWLELFDAEIARKQPTRHVAIGWTDEAPGDPSALVEHGLVPFDSVVLWAPRLTRPRHLRQDLEVRVLQTDEEWERACALQIMSRDAHYDLEGYTEFKTAQMKRYRAIAERGHGAWFGAFIDDQLVGDMGIFARWGTARYQSVETHPDFRRQGICQTLLWRAAEWSSRRHEIEQIVIAAEPGAPAERIYRSVGLTNASRQYGLHRWDGAA